MLLICRIQSGALKIYIQMDMDGLKDSVVRMLAGEAVPIHIGTFSNDMTTFATKDDVRILRRIPCVIRLQPICCKTVRT